MQSVFDYVKKLKEKPSNDENMKKPAVPFSTDVETALPSPARRGGGIDLVGGIQGALLGFSGGPDAVLALERSKQAAIDAEADRAEKVNQFVMGQRMKEQELSSEEKRAEAQRAFTANENALDRSSSEQRARIMANFEREKMAADATKQSAKQEMENKPKQMPAAQVAAVSEGAGVLRMLPRVAETIEKNKEAFGPVVGRLRSMNPYDETSKTIESEMRATSQAFGRFMEGGVLRKEDEDKYRKMFPQVGDAPEIAKAKLKVVDELLRQKYGDTVQALRGSNWDTSGLETLNSQPVNNPVDKSQVGSSGLTAEQRRARIAELRAKLGK